VDERAELERLRAEVAALRAQPPQPQPSPPQPSPSQPSPSQPSPPQPSPPQPVARPRRRISWRGPAASLLVILGCVLAPLSVVAVWSSNQVSNTDRYVANVAPLISEPAIQGALTTRSATRSTPGFSCRNEPTRRPPCCPRRD
jgi:hypothetical protein